MKPAIAQVCTLSASLESDVEDYAAGACSAIELWLGKVESYLERHSAAELGELLARHGTSPAAASFQGGLLTSQGESRREHWAALARRLDVCRQLGVPTLIVAGDIGGPFDQQDLDRVKVSLREAARLAADHGVRLALEPQGRAVFANNLQTAAALVAEIESSNLGLCLDAFHYYIGPSKAEDLEHLTGDNLFHVQLCDVAGVPRELATDADRVLPGDGDFLLRPIVDHLLAIDYAGYVSVELMNPHIWQIPPRQFGEIAMTALRKVLGQASMA